MGGGTCPAGFDMHMVPSNAIALLEPTESGSVLTAGLVEAFKAHGVAVGLTALSLIVHPNRQDEKKRTRERHSSWTGSRDQLGRDCSEHVMLLCFRVSAARPRFPPVEEITRVSGRLSPIAGSARKLAYAPLRSPCCVHLDA